VLRTQKMMLLTGLTLAFAALWGEPSEARHRGHHGQLDPDSAEALMRSPPLHGGPLGTMLIEFIRDCAQQASDLKNFPADEVAQTITSDNTQADALKDARRIADKIAENLAQSCPQDMPADPAGRLDAVDRGVSAVEAAIDRLRPAVNALSRSLDDDQKTRLTGRYVDRNDRRSGSAETTGSAGLANESQGRSRMSGEDSAKLAPPASQVPWNCEQWQAELRAWPIAHVEKSIAVDPRQRAAFYELAAAMQKAADTLADSCPQNPQNVFATPNGRIDSLKKKLDALRQSIATIRPALGRFYGVLDSGQKARFNDAI
jgi:hypothetical protein